MTPIVERTTVHISDDTGRIAILEKRTVGSAADDHDTDPLLTRYIDSNHLQSVSLELDENAEVISYVEYHPYGTTAYQASTSAINAVAKRYRYTGKERDDESGLYYHGARYYVPWLGRWTACDPLESKYAGMSPYNYCLNNPVANIDSDGRDVITFHYLHSVQNSLLEKSDNKRDNTSLRSFGKSDVASGSSSFLLMAYSRKKWAVKFLPDRRNNCEFLLG